jgi:hypothetical protein
MAAPSVGSVGTHRSGTTTFFDCPVPSGVVNGSLVVVYCFLDSTVTFTTLATGFAHAPGSPMQVGGGSGNHSLNVMWKRATGSDSGNYTFNQSASQYRAGNCIRYTNTLAVGDPWDDFDGQSSTANGTGTIPVSVDTTGPDRLLCWSATNWSGGTWTHPSTFTARFGTEDDRVIAGSDKSFPTAGASGSIAGSCSSSDKRCAWLGALIGTTGGATGGDEFRDIRRARQRPLLVR